MNKRAFSVKEFCQEHNIGKTTFYGLLRSGEGPRIMRIGPRGVRISEEAARDWRFARERYTKRHD